MKKLLLIGLAAGVLAFVPAQRSDAQVYFSVGFGGPGYYGYYPYGYYYPYRYSTTDRIAITVITGLTIGMAGIGITIVTTDTTTTMVGRKLT